jgi:hypothetical protein
VNAAPSLLVKIGDQLDILLADQFIEEKAFRTVACLSATSLPSRDDSKPLVRKIKKKIAVELSDLCGLEEERSAVNYLLDTESLLIYSQ